MTALDAVIGHIGAAAPYARPCGLVRAHFVDDDQPCGADNFDEIFVHVPDEGFDECGCPRHAAAVIDADPTASITRISASARTVLLDLLADGFQLPPPDGGPGSRPS